MNFWEEEKPRTIPTKINAIFDENGNLINFKRKPLPRIKLLIGGGE